MKRRVGCDDGACARARAEPAPHVEKRQGVMAAEELELTGKLLGTPSDERAEAGARALACDGDGPNVGDTAATGAPEPHGPVPIPVRAFLGEPVVERLAPEEALLDAACALDFLARQAMAGGRSDLTKAQADIVMRIALFGPTSMTRIATDLAVSKEYVTRAVADLEEHGFVTKRRRADNYRMVEAVLTEKGEAAAVSLRRTSIARLDTLLSPLNTDERAELADLAARVTELTGKIRA